VANLREIFQDISENIDLGEFNIESIPEDVVMPENFKDEFHQKYLTVVAAKNNPLLMGHFKGKYLSSIDLKLKNGLISLGFTEEEIAELKGQESDSLKLVDLAFNKIGERKSSETPNNDKGTEALKKAHAKQVSELQGIIEKSEEISNSKLSEVNSKWKNQFRDSKLNEILSGKTFDSNIPVDDIKILIKSKIAQSNYDIRLQDDLTFKVFDKNNPDVEAIIEGKTLKIDDIIGEFASVYTEKNQQTTETKPEKRVVEVATVENNSDGAWRPGHKDYGKKV